MEAEQQDRADENEEITFKDGNTDISQQLMDRYSKSSAAQHRHLVATAVAMRSILTSESLPPSPPAFFAAAISSVDSSTSDPVAVSSLLTFLSLVVPLVPPGEISATMAREAVNVLVKAINGEGSKLGVASLRAGVKCIGALLVAFCNLDDWESLQVGFDSLLKFSIDKRPKVRRGAQECLEKLFGSLRSATVINEASSAVYALLKEYKPVLSDLCSTKVVEGSKVESENVEAAHVLNVLSATIPFLSVKVTSRIFSELCKLMTSQFSPLTRQILKAIDTVFKNSEDRVGVPEMEGLLTSLNGYMSLHNENPADTIMHVTTLSKSTLEKVYSVEPTTCVSKLPLVCGSLAGLLTSKDDDIASQASNILKDLINSHIDTNNLVNEESLSCEDEDNLTGGDNINAARDVCTVFENTLNSCDGIPKEHILTVTALLIKKLGELSCILTKNIILKLADFMENAKGDAFSSQHVQQCIGSAVVAMGPVKLLALLPITLHAESNSCTNAWLIPILRRYIIGASLEYYIDHIVPLAKSLMLASKEAKKSAQGKKLRACGHELLRLLPSFCNYPVDMPQKFGSLAKLMVKFIKKKSFMHEAVALSVQMLVNQNKKMPKSSTDIDEAETDISEDTKPELESRFVYTKKTSTKNMKALASNSAQLLQTLVDVFTVSSTETSAHFKAAIGCLASTLDSSLRKKILISLLNKFDPAGESEIEGKVDESNEQIVEEEENCSTKTQLKRSAVLDLASSFVEGAKEDLIELIYNLVRQSFQATDEAVLRGAYDTLSRVLQEHGWFCSSHFADVIEMLLSHKNPEDPESSESRFACFHVLMAHGIQSSSEEENEKAFLILNEMILTLKDGKEEHRKATCDALVMVYTTLKNSSSITGDELCPKLINMITGYISGSSPHIRSGAVSALSVLIYKDPEICLSSPDLVSSVLSLLHTKSIEIIKAVLGFVKVLVSTLQAQDLQNLLQNLLYEILPWSSVSRHYFKSKVTIIVEIMIRKCGTRSVQFATPDKHKDFLQTVLENRTGKSKDKEETNDSQTTSIDPSKERRKRNHREISSETADKQGGGKENNKFKRQKRTHTQTPASDNNRSRTGPKRSGNKSFGKHREASENSHKSGKETRKPQRNRFRKAP